MVRVVRSHSPRSSKESIIADIQTLKNWHQTLRLVQGKECELYTLTSLIRKRAFPAAFMKAVLVVYPLLDASCQAENKLQRKAVEESVESITATYELPVCMTAALAGRREEHSVFVLLVSYAEAKLKAFFFQVKIEVEPASTDQILTLFPFNLRQFCLLPLAPVEGIFIWQFVMLKPNNII